MSRENIEAYALGGIGLARGVYELSIGERSQSTKAWLAIGIGVLAYDAICKEGQTLSEGVDRALECNKIATIGAIAVTSAHLLNLIPEKYDPFSIVAKNSRRLFKH